MSEKIKKNELYDLIDHMWIHSNYKENGYWKMTTEQKNIYRKVILRQSGHDLFEDEKYRT